LPIQTPWSMPSSHRLPPRFTHISAPAAWRRRRSPTGSHASPTGCSATPGAPSREASN